MKGVKTPCAAARCPPCGAGVNLIVVVIFFVVIVHVGALGDHGAIISIDEYLGHGPPGATATASETGHPRYPKPQGALWMSTCASENSVISFEFSASAHDTSPS